MDLIGERDLAGGSRGVGECGSKGVWEWWGEGGRRGGGEKGRGKKGRRGRGRDNFYALSEEREWREFDITDL